MKENTVYMSEKTPPTNSPEFHCRFGSGPVIFPPFRASIRQLPAVIAEFDPLPDACKSLWPCGRRRKHAGSVWLFAVQLWNHDCPFSSASAPMLLDGSRWFVRSVGRAFIGGTAVYSIAQTWSALAFPQRDGTSLAFQHHGKSHGIERCPFSIHCFSPGLVDTGQFLQVSELPCVHW